MYSIKNAYSVFSKQIFLMMFLLLFAGITFAQKDKGNTFSIKIDTLKIDKKDFAEEVKIKSYLDFIYDNFRSEVGNGLNICDFLYNRSKEIKNKALMASALNIKASIYALKNDFSNATKFYLDAADLFEKVNQPYSTAMMYNNIGLMYNNTNNKKAALQYLQKGLKFCELNKLEKPKALIHINLANLFITEGNLDLALENALKADALCLKLNMKIEQAVNANLIGAVYFYQNNFNKALEFYRLSYQLSLDTKDEHSQNIALNNIGEVLALQKNPETIATLQSPEKYFGNIKDYVSLQQTYTYYTTYYRNIKDAENTIKFLDKLRNVDSKLNDSLQRKSIVFYQTKYETQQKENKIQLLSKSDSIKNLKIFSQELAINKNILQLVRQKLALSGAQLQMVEDSLQISIQSKTILKNQLETAQKQEKINVLSKEALAQELALKEKEIAITQKNYAIASILGLSAILFLIGFGIYRKKQSDQKAFLVAQQNKQRELLTKAVIEAEESERKRIASDLHDGVGQLFSAVKMNLNGLLDRIEINKEEDKFLAEKTMALVDESCKEVRVISHKMMPNFLLKSGISSDIKSFIEKIDETALKIVFESNGFKEQLEFNEEIILYRVIQELINNVIKHAKANELKIVLQKNKQFIEVKIADNGIGFDYENAISKGGLGLKNILVRIEYLKGSVQFLTLNPHGTEVVIQVPIT